MTEKERQTKSRKSNLIADRPVPCWVRLKRAVLVLGVALSLLSIGVPASRSAEPPLKRETAHLLVIAHTEPNWPYIWLARLESVQWSGSTPIDSTRAAGERFFLKGIAYFFIVPEYSRRRDFNRRLQILEKVLDNWKASAAAWLQLRDPNERREAQIIQSARERVFRRYLAEKRTRGYRGQTLKEIFAGLFSQPCSTLDSIFVASVVCRLNQENFVQTQ